MNHRTTGALALLVVAAGALTITAQEQPAPPKLETLDQKAGYALGYDMGMKMKQSMLSLDADTLARGVKDALGGAEPAMDQATIQRVLQEWQDKGREAMQAKQAEDAKKHKAEGDAFLEKNKTQEGVQVTPSGLQYKMIKAGNGQKPAATDTVVVHYEGTLIDGTKFDSSYDRGQPATFPLNRVIPGWTEGLQLMDVGSQYTLWIPSQLAYGETPRPGGPIPPNAVLIFKVELVEIKK